MRHVRPLLLVACAASSALAQAGTASLESRVADALAAEVRRRMGVSAVVSVDTVEFAVRSRVEGSVGVTIAPGSHLGAPVEFGIVGVNTGMISTLKSRSISFQYLPGSDLRLW